MAHSDGLGLLGQVWKGPLRTCWHMCDQLVLEFIFLRFPHDSASFDLGVQKQQKHNKKSKEQIIYITVC